MDLDYNLKLAACCLASRDDNNGHEARRGGAGCHGRGNFKLNSDVELNFRLNQHAYYAK
jgi:hypothetical protein